MAWKSRFSRAVSWMSSDGSWNTRPMRERTPSGSRETSRPATRALPDVGLRSVQRTEIVVDLPAPLGPRNPKISPRRTARSMPRTASTVPYLLTRPVTSMTRSRPSSAGGLGRSASATAVMCLVCRLTAGRGSLDADVGSGSGPSGLRGGHVVVVAQPHHHRALLVDDPVVAGQQRKDLREAGQRVGGRDDDLRVDLRDRLCHLAGVSEEHLVVVDRWRGQTEREVPKDVQPRVRRPGHRAVTAKPMAL